MSAATQNAPVSARMHKKQWGIFVQDSWKVTRKLTIDYGLRWDYATAAHEQYGRSANLGMIPNPAVGNRIGAPIFEATCGCDFVSNYPYAVAPRFGFPLAPLLAPFRLRLLLPPLCGPEVGEKTRARARQDALRARLRIGQRSGWGTRLRLRRLLVLLLGLLKRL